MKFKQEQIEQFQKKVFAFYRDNRRTFPWRETTDRYAVLVSEIMLQQTRAERVVGKFPAWLERFPDIRSLADASLKEVLSYWSGLGYNARGQRLHRCAEIIAGEYGGVVPSLPETLINLPGIGVYTSRSIPVFADNRDIAAVDTNIRRIYIHELGLPENIRPAELLCVAEAALPCGRSRDWHNALMDYGALCLTGKRTGIRPLTRQSKFEGSKRWYRGKIVRDLVTAEALRLEELTERYGEKVVDALTELESEGLVESYTLEASGTFYKIPE
ncbi:MAG: Fe-S cluster assembly protein HesB [Chlorobiales bacterium]|nr:Fe-S cluster assembly protein HesB [Chlorobiales bacterium]